MPVVTFECENDACKRTYDVLIGPTIADQSAECPFCKSEGVRLFSPTSNLGAGVLTKHLSDGARLFHRRAQKGYERRAEEIRSGQLEIHLNPKRDRSFDPQIPKRIY